jgi:hypothetical protein
LGYGVKLTPRLSDASSIKRISKELNLEGFQVIAKNYGDYENDIYGFML